MKTITYFWEVEGVAFSSAELCVQSVKLSYHKVARVIPNAALTRCTIVFDDGKKENKTIEIKKMPLYHNPEHL